MPEAVTTQHETLWIGVNRSAMVRVPYVVSSPEIAGPVQPIDATNLASDMRVYIPGIKDYSGDLVWEANSQRYRPGELRDLLAMDGCHVWAERRMPMVGMRVCVEGEASVSMSAADPDGIQRVTVRIAPTAPMAVEEWSESMSEGYLYRIRVDDTGMNILHVSAAYGGRELEQVVTRYTRQQGAANIPHEWDWNGGVGPFGCWYGAFNVDAYAAGTESEEPISAEAGRLAFRLDPYDLGRTLAGTELTGTYNTMLVIPTVYWRVTGNDLYLSSSPSYRGVSGMVAYAHTATLPGGGTRVYPYIAIGVYEAYSDGTRLLSATGRTPVRNLTYQALKELADGLDSAGSSDWQMSNHYMWTLLKMMVYAVLGTKNMRWALGPGAVSRSGPSTTGLADAAGPYADSQAAYDKCFVENLTGSVYEILGDTALIENVLCVGRSLGGAEIGSQPASPSAITQTAGWVTGASALADGWDVPSATGETSTLDDPASQGAYANAQAGGTRIVLVGGRWSIGERGNLASIDWGYGSGSTRNFIGTRISAYLDDYAVGLTDEAPAALMSAPLTLSMGQSTPDEEEAEESEEEAAELDEEPEETPEETDTIEEDMR